LPCHWQLHEPLLHWDVYFDIESPQAKLQPVLSNEHITGPFGAGGDAQNVPASTTGRAQRTGQFLSPQDSRLIAAVNEAGGAAFMAGPQERMQLAASVQLLAMTQS
jgi:hypothetical protein